MQRRPGNGLTSNLARAFRAAVAVDTLAGNVASLMRGEKDLAEMRALKQAGLAQVSIDTFTNGVLEIAINAIMTAVP